MIVIFCNGDETDKVQLSSALVNSIRREFESWSDPIITFTDANPTFLTREFFNAEPDEMDFESVDLDENNCFIARVGSYLFVLEREMFLNTPIGDLLEEYSA